MPQDAESARAAYGLHGSRGQPVEADAAPDAVAVGAIGAPTDLGPRVSVEVVGCRVALTRTVSLPVRPRRTEPFFALRLRATTP